MIRINRFGALAAMLASLSLTAGVPATAAATNKGKHCVKYKKYHGKKRCSKYSKK
ncbi:MAG: hypothetical protein NVSMB51_09030 [Solirubrobacteraceae bacterium]